MVSHSRLRLDGQAAAYCGEANFMSIRLISELGEVLPDSTLT